MSQTGVIDRVVLDAESVDETAGAVEFSAKSVAQQGLHHHISWGTGVTSGVVEIECADSADYAGTWAHMATVTFAGTAPNQNYVYTPGCPKAIRHRISTVVADGTVSTRIHGAL